MFGDATISISDNELTNNSANIRRLKARIAELEGLYNSEPLEHETEDFKVYIEDGRVCFEFTGGKPSAEVRGILKNNGFNFSKSRGCLWVRKSTANAVYATKTIIKQLGSLSAIY